MSEIGFLRDSSAHLPTQRHIYGVAWMVYAVLLVGGVALIRPHPIRMNAAGSATHVGIAAFSPGPVGTTGTTATKAPAVPKKTMSSQVTRATAVSHDEADANQGSGVGAGQDVGSGSGPVNLGTGAGLTLLRKVTPTYPRMMEQVRMAGTVVLDAIIHRDGTIGDVTVKSATNEAFAQTAVEAVKRWRYTPIPYEGIVTVTVNFNLSH